MFLGIDVGGTFTDAALVDGHSVRASAKRPTRHEDIAAGLLAAVGDVLRGVDAGLIERVSISTTLVTNAAAAGRLPAVALYVIPGPGMDCREAFPAPPVVLDGYTDHCGQTAQRVDLTLSSPGPDKPAVASGKFSVRNPDNELALAAKLKELGVKNVVAGHNMSGRTGFIRRTNSAYFTAAAAALCDDFFAVVRRGLRQYALNAPLYVLKADGGTMPEALAKERAAETYFTGPAASAVGIQALAAPARRAVSLDVGGTTTDIALWENAAPLLAKRGARINGYPTAVRALQLSTVSIGGDSWVRTEAGVLRIGPERRGPAMALGGAWPTLTDAFLLLGLDDFGDRDKARAAMAGVAPGAPEAAAAATVELALERLAGAIEEMIDDHAREPVYRVDDVVGARRFLPELLIGVGDAAQGLIPALGRRLKLPADIPAAATVANAVGAAVARPTVMATLWADTARGYGILPEAARRFAVSSDFSGEQGEKILDGWLRDEARRLDITFTGAETVWREEFPVVREGWRSGNIINLARQLTPGVITGEVRR